MGTFARVRVVIHKDTNKYYALKIMKKYKLCQMKQLEHLKSEINILNILTNYPFIIQIYSYFDDYEHFYILTNFINGGELFTHLRMERKFNLNKTKFYTICIISALSYLHSNNIIYRDLKPENILIGADGYPVLSDFGFSKRLLFDDKTYTLCGTVEYLAPEIIQGKGHDKNIDWWALGILIYEQLMGYPPFTAENEYDTYTNILKKNIYIPKTINSDIKKLIKKLLKKNVKKRLCYGNKDGLIIKKYSFFNDIDWNTIEKKKILPPYIPIIQFEGDTHHFEFYNEQDNDNHLSNQYKLNKDEKKFFKEL